MQRFIGRMQPSHLNSKLSKSLAWRLWRQVDLRQPTTGACTATGRDMDGEPIAVSIRWNLLPTVPSHKPRSMSVTGLTIKAADHCKSWRPWPELSRWLCTRTTVTVPSVFGSEYLPLRTSDYIILNSGHTAREVLAFVVDLSAYIYATWCTWPALTSKTRRPRTHGLCSVEQSK